MRAADDFVAIRARLEELRRERERPAGQDKNERAGAPRRWATEEEWKAKVLHRPGLE